VTIEDAYALTRRARQITMSVLTPCACSLEAGGTIRFSRVALPGGRESGSGTLEVVFGAATAATTIEHVPLTDARLSGVWGEGLTRIVFTLADPPAAGRFTFVIKAG
jgi:hypothetical protein